MSVGAANNFSDKSGKLWDRHMLGEAVVVDPVRACLGKLGDLGIF